jgi:hypothetical protein
MQRALKATQAAGLPISHSEVSRDGTIRIFIASEQTPQQPNSLENWKAKRNARSA